MGVCVCVTECVFFEPIFLTNRGFNTGQEARGSEASTDVALYPSLLLSTKKPSFQHRAELIVSAAPKINVVFHSKHRFYPCTRSIAVFNCIILEVER